MSSRDHPPETLSDAEVIARSRVDPKSFAVIFDRHYAVIRRYLVSSLVDSLAVAADRFEGLLGGLGPDVRSWVLVPVLDPGADVLIKQPGDLLSPSHSRNSGRLDLRGHDASVPDATRPGWWHQRHAFSRKTASHPVKRLPQPAARPAFRSHASVSSSRSSCSGAPGRSTATAASRLPQ
jgi:hypothetical protein